MFYGPVWFVISLTFAIYLSAGSVIYHKRRQLRGLGGIESLDSDAQPESPFVKLAGIRVTSEIAFSPERRSMSTSDSRPTRSFTASSLGPYSVTIEGGGREPLGFIEPLASLSASNRESSCRPGPSPLRTEISLKKMRTEGIEANSQRRVFTETNSAAWAYTKYAILFFIALLVTWVCLVQECDPSWKSVFVSLTAIQVPSTVNRVYALARPDDFSFGLNYASSFVLPLQGFWNSLIYVSISWPAFKTLWLDCRHHVLLLRRN